MTEAEKNLCQAWDLLNSAIKRIEVSQPHGMTAAVEELETRRKQMENVIHKLLQAAVG